MFSASRYEDEDEDDNSDDNEDHYDAADTLSH